MTRDEVNCYHIYVTEAAWLSDRLKKMRVRIDNPRVPQLTGLPGARQTTPGSAQERYADEYMDTAPKYEEQLAVVRGKLRRIEEAVDRLPPKDRMAVRWHCFERLSYKHIADRMDVSVSLVSRIMSHAYSLLEEMEDERPAEREDR